MSFRYSGDKLDGIINYLTKIKQIDIVSLNVSSTFIDSLKRVYYKENVLEREEEAIGISSWVSESGNVEWLSVKFQGIKPIITHYTIQSHQDEKYYLRSWYLQGSNDNKNWVDLHYKKDSTDLANNVQITYKVNNINHEAFTYYRYYKNTSNPSDNIMRIRRIEFFGTIFPIMSCFVNQKSHQIYLLIFIFITETQ